MNTAESRAQYTPNHPEDCFAALWDLDIVISDMKPTRPRRANERPTSLKLNFTATVVLRSEGLNDIELAQFNCGYFDTPGDAANPSRQFVAPMSQSFTVPRSPSNPNPAQDRDFRRVGNWNQALQDLIMSKLTDATQAIQSPDEETADEAEFEEIPGEEIPA